MKAAIAAIALSTIAVAVPTGAAEAQTVVSVGIETPGFGVRIGAPVVPAYPAPVFVPVPAYPAPVFVPVPVYAPPPVMYLPPRVVVRPPVVYPIAYPYGPAVVKRHRHHRFDDARLVAPAGYAYGRY